MPLRRFSFSRRRSTGITSPPAVESDDAMPNGKISEKVTILKANGTNSITTASTEITSPDLPGSAGHSNITRKESLTSPQDVGETGTGKGRDGKKLRRSSNSNSSVGSSKGGGLAQVRRTSRDCVIPEPIGLTSPLNMSDVVVDGGEIRSPVLKIQDCDSIEQRNQSRPITLQRIRNEERDCISIQELSESPQRFGNATFGGRNEVLNRAGVDAGSKTRLSVTSSHDSVDGDHMIFQPPSSPLLVAMRTAVDSLNQFDDFEILEEIGAGFFAEVFKVRHKPTGQLMVLKRSKRKTVSLLKEVELLKRLKHPNILHYVGACIHGGQLNPLTEYVSGGTLEQLLQGQGELSWPRRLHLSLDVSRGMQYLHEHGMFHRDLNSRNVLLRRHGTRYTAVVADFGLAAKTIPSSSFNNRKKQMKRSQSIVGTPYWMAPEVLNGKPYDESADVFSYGIVLCEVISRLSADPDDIPRLKDYGLNVVEFRKLPEVQRSQCPEEFMELAILACKLLPIERPEFSDITTRLYIIRELHPGAADSAALSQESLEDTDDTIVAPQPPIRLGYHSRHQTPSPPTTSPLFSAQQSTGFTVVEASPRQQPSPPPPIHTSTSRETRV